MCTMPLALSGAEWARLVRWTQPEPPTEAARRAEYGRQLDCLSREMTRAWPNSLENVNKRNEELRRLRSEAAERTNADFYREYVRRRQRDQLQLMQHAKDAVFRNKDAPKLLRSAVIESAVLAEQAEQRKFNAARRQERAKQRQLDDAEVVRHAGEWSDLMALRERRRFEANKRHQREIVKQAAEVRERNRRERDTELDMQKLDNKLAEQEMEAIREFEQQFKAKEKARIWSDMERSHLERQELLNEQAARDRMDDRLIEALQRARARVDTRRRDTELQERKEKLRVLELISQKLESGDAARDAKEQAALDKAVAERHQLEDARHLADERKRIAFARERAEIRAQAVAAADRRRHKADTARRWDLVNRFKNVELYEEFQENLRKEKERKTKEHRDDIIKQWKERTERERRETAERRQFYGPEAESKLRAADNQLLTHGGALLREADRLGRPTYPIHRAIHQYCKMYRLYPMPELPRSQQEHFGRYAPRDSSAPDPGYKEPRLVPRPDSPPPPALPRDGLPRKQADSSEPRTQLELYKREVRADGLQRKHSQTELPNITGRPYASTHCDCFEDK